MLLDILFPNHCLHCNRLIETTELLCELCYDEISFSAMDFYSNNILQERTQLLFPCVHSYALLFFQKNGLSQKIIHLLKYGQQEKVGHFIAQWITDRVLLEASKPDLIVSVPLHPKKQKKRGYNQLHLFGDQLSKYYNIPINHNFLKRNSHTSEQAKKDKLHRNQTASIFSVTENMDAAHILLIDDVYTTGNTLSTIAWEILKSNPQHQISIMVMAMDV
ncbi:ComF family protein [Chryseobacterium sp. T1]